MYLPVCVSESVHATVFGYVSACASGSACVSVCVYVQTHPGDTQESPRRPGNTQEATRDTQEPPRSTQEAPEGPQGGPQEAPRMHPKTPRRPPRAPRTTQEAPGTERAWSGHGWTKMCQKCATVVRNRAGPIHAAESTRTWRPPPWIPF